MTTATGNARIRVDADAKVRGAARYTAEHDVEKLVYGVLALSRIAKGRIADIDTSAAAALPNVIGIMTYRNAPRVNGGVTGKPGIDKHLLLMQDDRIAFDRQPVAVAIATTLEAALEAAARIEVRYDAEEPVASLADPRGILVAPKETPHGEPADMTRGHAAAARSAADVVVGATYTTPMEHHNALELHATIAAWNGDRLTIYDATQGVFEDRRKIAGVFGIAPENVHVISPFTGGGFGGKGSVWHHQPLAAMAARFVGRPVKIELARDHVFGTTGHRPATIQRVVLAARRDGTIVSMEHDITASTSTFDDWMEASGESTTMLYAIANVDIRHRMIRTNLNTPTFMRAPGEATGTYVLEVAMDELAERLDLDPIELRLRNYAQTDPHTGKPYSSKGLRACYARGAELFGWRRRGKPRSARSGRDLVGYGMASGAYPANIFKAAATVRLAADGRVTVRSGTHEIGQGSYTALADIAATELGIAAENVRMELGDTQFPQAMNSGGSTTIASVGSAIALACRQIATERSRNAAGSNGDGSFEATAEFEGTADRERFTCYSFCAQFAEVRVDPDFGTVRLHAMVGVFDVGRVINERLAHSQFVGAMTMGAGMALFERTRVDPRTARILNANLAEYLIPTNADIGTIVAEAVPSDDTIVNPIGTKAVGEIGICGAAAAIANAVYNATGERVRNLPIGLVRTL